MDHVRLPRQLEVLCRDLLAGDNSLDDAISITEELHGQLAPWLDELNRHKQQLEDEEARELRRQLRRVERRQT